MNLLQYVINKHYPLKLGKTIVHKSTAWVGLQKLFINQGFYNCSFLRKNAFKNSQQLLVGIVKNDIQWFDRFDVLSFKQFPIDSATIWAFQKL